MHYLCIANSFDINNSTGSGRLNDMIAGLIKQGHYVTLITSSFDYLTGNVLPTFKGGIVSNEDYKNLRIIRGWCYTGYNKRKFGRILTFVSFLFSSIYSLRYVSSYDKIFVGTPPFFLGIPGLIAKYLKKSDLFYEVRDLWVDVAIELGYLKSKFIIKLIRLFEKKFYLNAKKIITNSLAFSTYIANTGISVKKIIYIPNGVSLNMFFPDSEQNNDFLRKKLGINNKFIVIYTGAHGEANNLSYVLEAAKILKQNDDIYFMFVGDGNRKKLLLEKVKKENLHNVKFLDPIPKNKLYKYVSMSNVGIAILKPTNYLKTTYPNKVFDYMACKIPCIIAIDGVIRELVESNDAGLFSNPYDPKSLADTILKMEQTKKSSLIKMGENGYKVISNSFNRVGCTDELIKQIT